MVEDKHAWILQRFIGEDCWGVTGHRILELEQSQNQEFGHNYKEFMWKTPVGKATVVTSCTLISASPCLSTFTDWAAGLEDFPSG